MRRDGATARTSQLLQMPWCRPHAASQIHALNLQGATKDHQVRHPLRGYRRALIPSSLGCYAHPVVLLLDPNDDWCLATGRSRAVPSPAPGQSPPPCTLNDSRGHPPCRSQSLPVWCHPAACILWLPVHALVATVTSAAPSGTLHPSLVWCHRTWPSHRI